jgi:hypothetical protein
MIREQRIDSFCKEQVQNRLRAIGDYFLDMDAVLYRRVKVKHHKLLVSMSQIQNIITTPFLWPTREARVLSS